MSNKWWGFRVAIPAVALIASLVLLATVFSEPVRQGEVPTEALVGPATIIGPITPAPTPSASRTRNGKPAPDKPAKKKRSPDTPKKCTVEVAQDPPPPPEITIAQANIKTSLPGEKFAADLATTVADGPDLVSLNEVPHRSDSQLTPPGYGLHRGPATPPVSQTRSTAVLWRLDTWQKVDAGRILMVAAGPQKWDAGRSATWTTLRHEDGTVVSLVSLHHMINPARFGPDLPRRQRIYGEGLARVRDLVGDLGRHGPVFVAGDFNSRWSNGAGWAPRAMMASAGLTSAHTVLGAIPTHDGGAMIDLVLYDASRASAVAQSTRNLNSDHHLLNVRFRLTAPESEPVVQDKAGQRKC